MEDGVIPGGTWAVVAEVIPVHIAVVRKPTRVVVETLARAVERQRTGLAARRDAVGIRRFRDFGGMSRDIDEHPVKEIYPRQSLRNLAILLIDVVRLAGNVRVVADDHERFCRCRSI